MSGHSKWATTKHKKAVIDSRRAKSWAKLIKNIEVAAKLGGADLQGNPTLFDAVLKAKKTSVPKDNIDRAIKRGAGIGGESVEYSSIMYEGYGPNGVALMIECLTDNKNRAAAEVRGDLEARARAAPQTRVAHVAAPVRARRAPLSQFLTASSARARKLRARSYSPGERYR